jgi:hypothetical protein
MSRQVTWQHSREQVLEAWLGKEDGMYSRVHA